VKALLGSGPEVLGNFMPPNPVLIAGMPDSGRRTWADWVMRQHHARESMILRADNGLTMDQARDLRLWLMVRSRAPRWVSIDLDQTEPEPQNALLKLLEEPPASARILLRGQPASVLATIRSRCSIVRLTPASVDEEIEFVESAAGVSYQEALEAVGMARGRPGLALQLVGQSESADCAYRLVQAAQAGDGTALASALLDPQTDWTLVRNWIARWASDPPRVGVLSALRGVHEPRLAVRTALDRLART
jgi:hypothetical protein